ncbi:mannosyl-3-phosphoglycerate phosphatase-related protein, partial [Enterobacter hormaechei]
GLSRPRSVVGGHHEASVTLIWRDSYEQMRKFSAQLAPHRLNIVHGGPFCHIFENCCGKNVGLSLINK